MSDTINSSAITLSTAYRQFYTPSDPREIAKRANNKIQNIQDTVNTKRMNKALFLFNSLLANNMVEILSKAIENESDLGKETVSIRVQEDNKLQQQYMNSSLYSHQTPGTHLNIAV